MNIKLNKTKNWLTSQKQLTKTSKFTSINIFPQTGIVIQLLLNCNFFKLLPKAFLKQM